MIILVVEEAVNKKDPWDTLLSETTATHPGRHQRNFNISP